MISRGPLAYNAEETCRLVSMIIHDAIGNFGPGNGSDSHIIGRIENLDTALEVVTLTCFHLT